MKITWQLTKTDQCIFEWGNNEGDYNLGKIYTVENNSNINEHIHSIIISSLLPFHKYYYRVTLNNEYFSGYFNTAPDSETKSVKFIAYGDSQDSSTIQNIIVGKILDIYDNDEAYKTLIIRTGDITDGGTEYDFENNYFSFSLFNLQKIIKSIPVVSARGNHENSAETFKKYFSYPFVNSCYWSFDYGPVHFTIIDQYIDYRPGSEEYNWLVNDLANSNKLWKFIIFHEPGWSSGGSHPNNPDVQNYIQPLCELYNVSIIFSGHNHYYSRAKVNNVYHLTIGGGGSILYPPLSDQPNVEYFNMCYHLCKIEINDNILNFSVIKPDGSPVDSFIIIK
jgi:hypothetical protein